MKSLLFIVLGFSVITSNEAFNFKIPGHPLTPNGWCAQEQAGQGHPSTAQGLSSASHNSYKAEHTEIYTHPV